MATIYVEDRSYTADPKQNLLHACLSLGFNCLTSAGIPPWVRWARAGNAPSSTSKMKRTPAENLSWLA